MPPRYRAEQNTVHAHTHTLVHERSLSEGWKKKERRREGGKRADAERRRRRRKKKRREEGRKHGGALQEARVKSGRWKNKGDARG